MPNKIDEQQLTEFLYKVGEHFLCICSELGIDAHKCWGRNRSRLDDIVSEELRLYVNNLRSWDNCLASCAFQMIYGKLCY